MTLREGPATEVAPGGLRPTVPLRGRGAVWDRWFDRLIMPGRWVRTVCMTMEKSYYDA
jgi:hypothetical protein